MTIRELYEWAEEHDVADCKIEIQYRDGGGYYSGTDILRKEEIEIKNDGYREVIIL